MIFDPVMALLGNKDVYRDNEVRAALAPLFVLMDRYNATGLLVRHLTKKSEGVKAIYQGVGSIAFTGLVRGALMVKEHPTTRGQRVLSHTKSNLSDLAPPMLFHITSDEKEGDPRSYIVWDGETDASLEDLEATRTRERQTGSTRQQILAVLQDAAPEALSLQDIAAALPDCTYGNIAKTLERMIRDEQVIRSDYGSYSLPASSTPSN